MTANASPPFQREFKTKIPEPYPVVGGTVAGHLMAYLTVDRRNGNDPVFAFEQEETVNDVGMVAIRPDGTLEVRTASTQPETFARLNGDPASTPEPAPSRQPLSLPVASPVFRAARGIAARQAAVAGRERVVETFMAEVLGLWRGARWHEPVSTALLGNWVGSLHTDGRVPIGAMERLEAEVRDIHRQLTPLWERKINGERLRSMDFAVGDGLTVYDLVANGPDPYEVLTGTLPEDPRLVAVLTGLTPTERAVAMAWVSPHTTSWTDAAAHVIALDPMGCAGFRAIDLGERVRRKLKRLGERYTSRSKAAVAARQGSRA